MQIQPPPVTRRRRRAVDERGARASFDAHAACDGRGPSRAPRNRAGGAPRERAGRAPSHHRCGQPARQDRADLVRRPTHRLEPSGGGHGHRQGQHEPREHDDGSTQHAQTPGEHPRSLATGARGATTPGQVTPPPRTCRHPTAAPLTAMTGEPGRNATSLLTGARDDRHSRSWTSMACRHSSSPPNAPPTSEAASARRPVAWAPTDARDSATRLGAGKGQPDHMRYLDPRGLKGARLERVKPLLRAEAPARAAPLQHPARDEQARPGVTRPDAQRPARPAVDVALGDAARVDEVDVPDLAQVA